MVLCCVAFVSLLLRSLRFFFPFFRLLLSLFSLALCVSLCHYPCLCPVLVFVTTTALVFVTTLAFVLGEIVPPQYMALQPMFAVSTGVRTAETNCTNNNKIAFCQSASCAVSGMEETDKKKTAHTTQHKHKITQAQNQDKTTNTKQN